MINVTLQFGSYAEAASALSRLAAPAAIEPADNPSTGAPSAADAPIPAAAVTSAQAAAVFGAVVPPAPPVLPPAVAPTVAAIPAGTPPSAATVPTAAPATPTLEFDTRGLPWDGRIHAATKTKNADGSWRKLRGVDDGLLTQVEAELFARFGSGRNTAPPAPPALPALPAAPAPVAMPVPPTLPAAVAVPVPPVAAPAAPAPTVTACTDFASYMAEVGPAFDADPAGTAAKFGAACQAAGLGHLGALAMRPDLIPVVDRAYKGLPAA